MAEVLRFLYPFAPKKSDLIVLQITLLLAAIQTYFHFSYSSKPTGFSLKLIPKDSLESPLYLGNLTQIQQVERLINFSKARAHYLKYSASSLGISNNTIPSRLELLESEGYLMSLFHGGSGVYMVETLLGTPLQDAQLLLMDTGGGLVWTQCMPCKRCYKQTTSMYDSGASSSYEKLPCNHPLCKGPTFQCINEECVYSVRYSGGHVGPIKGVASMETFRFALNNGTIVSIGGIVFGCSKDSTNIWFEDSAISGIMGLSWSPDSLMTQLGDSIQHRFSYCLEIHDEDQTAPTLLTFGSAIPTPKGNVQTTGFARHPSNVNFYFYLNLLDISIGMDRLGFPRDTFKINQDGSGGVLIDSGTVMSFINKQDLPNGRNPYKEVMGAFQKHYDSFNLKRKRGENNVPKGFDLCYEKPRNFNQFARMTYHFDGADYIVDGRVVNYFDNKNNYFCVGLIGGSGFSILGARHQQNKRIVYDGNLNALQFTDEICEY